MDIPSFLITYGGPGGLALLSLYWAISERRFHNDQRAELREDIQREQADNADLRQRIRDKDEELAKLRLQSLRCDGHCRGGDNS